MMGAAVAAVMNPPLLATKANAPCDANGPPGLVTPVSAVTPLYPAAAQGQRLFVQSSTCHSFVRSFALELRGA